jgi:hypothetical protein
MRNIDSLSFSFVRQIVAGKEGLLFHLAVDLRESGRLFSFRNPLCSPNDSQGCTLTSVFAIDQFDTPSLEIGSNLSKFNSKLNCAGRIVKVYFSIYMI